MAGIKKTFEFVPVEPNTLGPCDTCAFKKESVCPAKIFPCQDVEVDGKKVNGFWKEVSNG